MILQYVSEGMSLAEQLIGDRHAGIDRESCSFGCLSFAIAIRG